MKRIKQKIQQVKSSAEIHFHCLKKKKAVFLSQLTPSCAISDSHIPTRNSTDNENVHMSFQGTTV